MRRGLAHIGKVPALLLFAVGCEGGAASRDEGASAPAPAPRPDLSSAPTELPDVEPFLDVEVDLLDAGAEPRQPLRYDLEVGDEQAVSIAMEMDLEVVVGGHQLSRQTRPSRIDARFRVDEIRPSGDVEISFTVLDAELPDLGVLVVEATLPTLVGERGSFVVDPRGFLRDQDLRFLADRPRAGYYFDLTDLVHPLPEEPVGPGAVWEIRKTGVEEGMTIDSVEKVELVQLDGRRGKAVVTIAQTTPPQRVASRRIPPTAIYEILGSSFEGGGELELSTDTIISPTRTEYDSEATMRLRYPGGSQDQDVRVSGGYRVESIDDQAR